jgi:hypothetical protein
MQDRKCPHCGCSIAGLSPLAKICIKRECRIARHRLYMREYLSKPENRKRQDAINRKSMRKTLADPKRAAAKRKHWREYSRLRYHRLKKKSGRKG